MYSGTARLARIDRIVYPSVVCAGISILVLAALFIFQKKDTLAESRKKLRNVRPELHRPWEQMTKSQMIISERKGYKW